MGCLCEKLCERISSLSQHNAPIVSIHECMQEQIIHSRFVMHGLFVCCLFICVRAVYATIPCSRHSAPYHTEHFLAGFILLPVGQLYASAKSFELDSGPRTLKVWKLSYEQNIIIWTSNENCYIGAQNEIALEQISCIYIGAKHIII